jgi:hypothetical protein
VPKFSDLDDRAFIALNFGYKIIEKYLLKLKKGSIKS